MESTIARVVAIGGESGAGMSTARDLVARALDYHQLDGGALYGIVALKCFSLGIDVSETQRVVEQTSNINPHFHGDKVKLNGKDISTDLRLQQVEDLTSQIAQIRGVKVYLEEIMLRMRKFPGLVADGCDIGWVFKKPVSRFYLTCNVEVRAARRVAQLQAIGRGEDFDAIFTRMLARDRTNQTRDVARFQRHENAYVIDTSEKSQSMVVAEILRNINQQ